MEEIGPGRSFDARRFTGNPNRDERLSGPFYVGRASFRMGLVEGGVVRARLIEGHTPARGVGCLPIDPDEDGPAEEWDAHLKEACGADTALRQQVEILLEAGLVPGSTAEAAA